MMITPTAACLHARVASHGVEPGDAARDTPLSAEDHETGWCRDCAEYVQRELGGSAWVIRPGYERGAWMWRA
jgi:hypothetical protein